MNLNSSVCDRIPLPLFGHRQDIAHPALRLLYREGLVQISELGHHDAVVQRR